MGTRPPRHSLPAATAIVIAAGGCASLLAACAANPPQPEPEAPSAGQASAGQRPNAGTPDTASAAAAPSAEPAAPPPARAQQRQGPLPADGRTTRLAFSTGAYKPAIETLRVVRPEESLASAWMQAGLNVGRILLAGGAATPFSTGSLDGEPVAQLEGDPLAVHPAMSDLNAALSEVATRIYRQRAERAANEARRDGASEQEIAEALAQPAEADAKLYAGPWYLIAENLTGKDEQYRLVFGAGLGTGRFTRKSPSCEYKSDLHAWTQWTADKWQLLRYERAIAVAACARMLEKVPAYNW